MRVYLLNPREGQPAALIGKYGKTSWAAQAPAEPDLYLQQVWPADADGRAPRDVLDQPGVAAWIDGDQILRIEIL